MIHDHDDQDSEFLTAACQAMRGPSGSGALDALGWWELLAHLADDDAQAAVFSAFRAQGRELASSSALGGILAHPYLELLGAEPGTVRAAIRRERTRGGPTWTVIGGAGDGLLLLDDPATGVHLVDDGAVALHPVEVPGRLVVHEATIDLTGRRPALASTASEQARVRSTYLGRVAAATEMLGASERAVATAVAYAGDREQFGRPIGTFQAVRHLLSWAKTECTAVDSVIRKAVLMIEQPPEQYGAVVKAIAGRNGRRACEQSLQVLGGIGFTAEHLHHHHHSRVLLLDAVLGSSTELTHDLGSWLRESGAEPGFASAVLAAEHR